MKYFALASFLVLIVFSFPFSVFISKKAKNILTESYENYALLLGQNLNYQVYQSFLIPVNMRFGGIKLREKEQYEWMDRVVKNSIHSFNIDVVNIYSINQKVIAYSTDPALIGKNAIETPGYKKAVNGGHSSALISKGGDLWGLGIERISNKKLVRTYIPFNGINPFTGKGEVFGVFELIQDMTEQYRSIVKFQFFIFGLSILIMALIFLALLLIVRKAEIIIEQRAGKQRELEGQLHLAERLAALGEMVAAVSHEIKNPLGIIQSTAELLTGMPGADEAHKKLSGVITEESIRLNRIVTEFLDFARPQEPVFQECHLKEIIRKNTSFLGPELEKKGIRVNDNLEDNPYRLIADPELLYRAFLNIFINAIQAMNNGGSITVKAGKEKGNYRIEIEDTGSGISQESMKKIFNPFFTTKDKGSGLGLPIVKKIIDRHKGTIGIESDGQSGTKVIIYLPQKV